MLIYKGPYIHTSLLRSYTNQNLFIFPSLSGLFENYLCVGSNTLTSRLHLWLQIFSAQNAMNIFRVPYTHTYIYTPFCYNWLRAAGKARDYLINRDISLCFSPFPTFHLCFAIFFLSRN